jgi:CBS domain containing-hemolysin-like protein
LQDLNRNFSVRINEEAETLSGLIIEKLGLIPKKVVKEEFVFEKLKIKIKSIKHNHIDKVIIERNID